MNKEERYDMIMDNRKNSIIEIGLANDYDKVGITGLVENNHKWYYICHSCPDGLFTYQGEENAIIKAVEHIAGEKHKILLMEFSK